ncbi:unnamed protein product, partial [Durusdinium trenchii]
LRYAAPPFGLAAPRSQANLAQLRRANGEHGADGGGEQGEGSTESSAVSPWHGDE